MDPRSIDYAIGYLVGVIMALVIIVVALGLLAAMGQWGWNTLAPAVGGPHLDYWPALVGVTLLAILGAFIRR